MERKSSQIECQSREEKNQRRNLYEYVHTLAASQFVRLNTRIICVCVML